MKIVQQFPDSKSVEWIIESIETIEGESAREQEEIKWGVLTEGSVWEQKEPLDSSDLGKKAALLELCACWPGTKCWCPQVLEQRFWTEGGVGLPCGTIGAAALVRVWCECVCSENEVANFNLESEQGLEFGTLVIIGHVDRSESTHRGGRNSWAHWNPGSSWILASTQHIQKHRLPWNICLLILNITII